METLSSTFSSLGFKKGKAFVGKEQNFMYVPKLPKPKLHNMFKIDRTFSSTMSGLHAESSTERSKVPISSICDEIIDLDTFFTRKYLMQVSFCA